MINYKPTLITELSALGYPVLLEDAMANNNTYPVITYFLSSDAARATGDTLGYSDIYYNIKVWGKRSSEIEPIAVSIDSKMRSLGFRRIATTELWFNGVCQKELRYQGLGRERFE